MQRRLFFQVGFVVASVACGKFGSLHGQPQKSNEVREQEFLPIPATLSVTQNGVNVDGTFFLPKNIGLVRGVIVVIRAVLGQQVYQDPLWRTLSENLRCGLLLAGVSHSGPPTDRPLRDQAVRNAAVGGGEGLLMLLERLAEQSGHQELKDAKVLVWGHSAAASFAITFAALYPKRTIAFVRYHSHLRGLSVDLSAVAQVPGLLFAGENDRAAGVEDAEALWKEGRAAKAPWTFAIGAGRDPRQFGGVAEGERSGNSMDHGRF